MSGKIVDLTDTNFDEKVTNSVEAVLVDYWAQWCNSCEMFLPLLDEIAEEYDGKLKVAKLNIDKNTETPLKYGVRGLPTVMIFKDGDISDTHVGPMSKSQLKAFIDSNL